MFWLEYPFKGYYHHATLAHLSSFITMGVLSNLLSCAPIEVNGESHTYMAISPFSAAGQKRKQRDEKTFNEYFACLHLFTRDICL